MRPHALLALALASAVTASCAHVSPAGRDADVSAPRRNGASALPASNILRADYVGSAACAGCHAKESEAWSRSPMHRMTRAPDAPDVRAPFDGRALHFKSDLVTLEMHDARRFIRIAHDGVAASSLAHDELYRVTRVIGGRTREDFAGVRVRDASDPKPESDEMVLPVSYLIFSGALRYKGYSVLLHERASASVGPVWSKTCLFCHNTVPFFSTLLGTLAGPGAQAYQGEDVDPLLPTPRQWKWTASDPDAAGRAATDEAVHLGAHDDGGNTKARFRDAIAATRDRFGGDALVEVGIGCESCHGGARVHLADPSIAPSFVPYAPFLSIERPRAKSDADARAQAIDRVCARCHQVLFSRYPWTWEGGRRQSADRGGSEINSGEARDFLLGGCASALACTACHDPHDARDRVARDAALATPAGNATCTRCHTELAGDDAARAHTHHDPRGAGGACIACHMPRKNLGLDLRLTRYHRIGSPTDPERVLRDRPLECALCHADKSVESLVSTMEKWWNKAYVRDLLTNLYGDLAARPLLATLERGKPHERAVAAAVLGEHHDRAAAPAIARELTNEYPLVRAFAARALTDALGKDCGIDVGDEEVPRIEEDVRACLASVGLRALAFPAHDKASKGDDEVPAD